MSILANEDKSNIHRRRFYVTFTDDTFRQFLIHFRG